MKSLLQHLLFALLFLGSTLRCFSQNIKPNTHSISNWQKANIDYYRNNLPAKDYLDEILKLANEDVANGIFYKDSEYLKLLNTFKNIAWSNDQFKERRETYYLPLANNARCQNLAGIAFYYAEKADALAAKNNKKTYYALSQKCETYIRHKEYEALIQEIKNNYNLKNEIPRLLNQNKLKAQELINLALLNNAFVFCYSAVSDTTAAYIHVLLGEKIREKAIAIDSLKNTFIPHLASFFQFSNIFTYLFETNKDIEKSGQYLDSVDLILANEQFNKFESPYEFVKSEYLRMNYNYFLKVNIPDSASYYLNRYKELKITTEDDPEIAFVESEIKAGKGDYLGAWTKLYEAWGDKTKEYAKLTADIDELLYAHTELEENKNLLLEAEIQKQKTNRWILAGILIALALAIVVYQYYNKIKQKLKAEIQNLNNNTTIKIAELEHEKRIAVSDEKEKLALELHDDLAAKIATAKYQLELIGKDLPEISQRSEYRNIRLLIENIYQTSRNKSHQWFQDFQAQNQNTFFESVTFITDSSLPDEKYKKDIQIEQEALSMIPLENRIIILKIIQEALINIIKHSKAEEVSIYIFKTKTDIQLQISDNGVGIKRASTRRGIGLNSIFKRAREMGGVAEILTDEGTTISIKTPIKS